jgi:MSHA biogenesis protein MshP
MNRLRQRGFTLVSAIFILVVLAALAAFIVVISTTQQIGSVLDVQGARAYQAARAGIEWGTYQIWSRNPTRNTNVNCDGSTNASVTTSFTFPASATTLSGFTVTVTCVMTTDAASGPTLFTVDAIACNLPGAAGSCPGNVGSAGYVERYVKATI